MKRDKVIWLFGGSDIDVEKETLTKFWQYTINTTNDVSAFIVVPKTSQNVLMISTMSRRLKERIIWKDSSAHLKIFRMADALFVSSSATDVRVDNDETISTAPIIFLPSYDDEPCAWLHAGSEDNCIFRYIVPNKTIYDYLTIARDFKDYQLLLLKDIYDEDSAKFSSAADELMENILFAHRNSVAFIGFALTHVGGTPVATHALAEGLLECGWFVKYICLRLSKVVSTPPGIPILAMDDGVHKRPARCKGFDKLLPQSVRLSHLKYDPGDFSNDCGILLKRALQQERVSLLVSTRESLHLFLDEVRNPYVSDKVYFFHCQSDVLKINFGRAVSKISKMQIKKAVFVTDRNRIALKEKFKIDNFGSYCVLGNGLGSYRMCERNEICKSQISNDVIDVCWLVRIEKERASDFENLFSFGTYLKENKIENVRVSVYGQGAYLNDFIDEIKKRGLTKIILHKGVYNNVKETYSKYDAVVDFTRIQSFGMVYIEAILNGRMVFCYRNEGSQEVLRDIPEAFFDTNEELLDKLNNLSQVTSGKMLNFYDLIAKRFSRQAIAKKFVSFVKFNG